MTQAVDLLGVDPGDVDGVCWSLARGGDLDANLVRLAAGGSVGAHVNDEVDVLFVGVAGRGEVTVDGVGHPLRPGAVVAVAKGAERAVATAPGSDVRYLTVHRARPGLGIGR
jgi:quercetin dioxygenase-like cupin family protein